MGHYTDTEEGLPDNRGQSPWVPGICLPYCLCLFRCALNSHLSQCKNAPVLTEAGEGPIRTTWELQTRTQLDWSPRRVRMGVRQVRLQRGRGQPTLNTGTAHAPISRANQGQGSVTNPLLFSGENEQEHLPHYTKRKLRPDGLNQGLILNPGYTLESSAVLLNC